MPKHPFRTLQGRTETFTITSSLLENCLGDPITREIAVYLPPNYDHSKERYPSVTLLPGFTASGLAHLGWGAYKENFPQRLERLIEQNKMGPVIAVIPDTFLSIGGNQFNDSPATGQWGRFLSEALPQEIEKRYRVKSGAKHRGVLGKSSGGYGAMIHGMKHGEHWGAIACHSGDMAFDLCFLTEFPKAVTAVMQSKPTASISSFVERFFEDPKVKGDSLHTLMILAMSSFFDPDLSAPYGMRLPVTLDSCELIPERWAQWLSWDPVQLVEQSEVQKRIKGLKIWIDCGTFDQYHLLFGARQLHHKMERCQIAHTYSEFPDNHSSIDYRMDESLPFLYQAIQ